MAVSTYRLLGVRINPLSIPDLHAVISEIVQSNQRRVIASQNLHSIYVYHHDAKMRAFGTRADYMRVDGMPIVLLGQMLGYPLTREHRVTYVDWIRPLMAEAARQHWRIFYMGSKPGVAERGADVLRQEFPGLEIQTTDGYFDINPNSAENQHKLALINAYQPDVLMVGMGMPRQEHWILENLDHIQAKAILTCGACIDYVAGEIPTPPRWMARLGFEWLARLFSEPKRLWKRYLVEPWFVASLFVRDLWKLRTQAK
ncbi:MAG: WecB/TagA/CpsF family glycosyltransferase [Cyanophyceae cyanobacterium]